MLPRFQKYNVKYIEGAIIGEAELASQLSKEQAEVESQKETIKLLREQITHLESHLNDKERIIKFLEERR